MCCTSRIPGFFENITPKKGEENIWWFMENFDICTIQFFFLPFKFMVICGFLVCMIDSYWLYGNFIFFFLFRWRYHIFAVELNLLIIAVLLLLCSTRGWARNLLHFFRILRLTQKLGNAERCAWKIRILSLRIMRLSLHLGCTHLSLMRSGV